MMDLLYEAGNTTARFQLTGVLPSSARARLVAADDLLYSRAVVLKAPSFRDPQEQRAREAALKVEAQAAAAAPWALAVSAEIEPRANTPLADSQTPHLSQVATDKGASHACLVMPHVLGERLDRWASTHHPSGAPAELVMTIAVGVLDALRAMHDAGFVHRRVSPEHVLLCADNTIQLVGFGGATVRNAGYPGGAAPYDPAYTAPECRTEISGRFNVPKADVFSLGLLMAYLATGERPSANAGSPLTRTAATRLLEHEVSLSLLIGKCLQPLQKNRMALKTLRPHLLVAPTETTAGFGPVELVATWRQEEISALPVGTLSPGPLVNRTTQPDARPESSQKGSAEPDDESESDTPGGLVQAQSTEKSIEEAAVSQTAINPAPGVSPNEAALAGSSERGWLRWVISALVIAIGAYLASRNLT
ncbi:MAG: serine/threonine protein kinase [Bradymonadia bacterium]|jgi:serine/threonine protein kinase